MTAWDAALGLRWSVAHFDSGPEVPAEVGVQLGEDVGRECDEDPVDHFSYGPAPDTGGFRTLIKDYVRGDVGFYVDVIGSLEGSDDLHNWSVLLYWPRNMAMSKCRNGSIEPDSHRTLGLDRASQWDEAVLVDVRHFLKLPKSEKDGVLPAVIGLKVLDVKAG